ncbi:flagellar hook protein FlgE [Alkalispirillum mobile]|uniref:Flagellar hook protein FlgE n=1 Tax=Alkalispirillum mobile TaxID=85925 RepID=A0A498C257_9GAMM|nr:flagellar hook protein FlgE [Alkalispirillum mobile]RLK48666.1 flagellar hook protein FlgE [Alkalispirillum mobile]
MSFGTSLTGLNAAQSDLDITGNNIANSNTTGFKESRAEFADLFSFSNLGVTSLSIGQGVRLQNVGQQFNQGQFDFTENSLDLGISGNGFFRMSDDGDVTYTRAGAFQLDRDGWITNSAGKRLTGYNVDEDGNNVGDGTQELRVQTGNVAPSATTEASVQANLDAGAEVIDEEDAFDPSDTATYNESTSTTFFDSQGNQRTANFFFRKVDDNKWDVHAQVDGLDEPVRLGADDDPSLEFDGNGVLESDGIFENLDFGLGEDEEVELDFSEITQFGSPFAVSDINQNGFAAGEFSSLDVESDGTIFARYTNGQSESLGRVGITKFPSQENLQPVGDTEWADTFEAGEPVIGTPGTSDFGQIESGALEQANVDISEQLVNMIVAQRNFSANAKMISTEDQITQEILNIR